MDRLTQEMAAARDEVAPDWDETRTLRVLSGIGQLRRRRQVTRAAGASMVGLLLVVATVGTMGRQQPLVTRTGHAGPTAAPVVEIGAGVSAAAPIGTVRAGHRLRLADGSMARLSGQSSELDILENATDNIALRLRSGSAAFDVVPNRERRFVVSAGEIDVVVVGTAFEVERQEGSVRVSVQHGKVRVVGPDGVRYLETGQSRRFVGVSGEVVEEPPAPGMGVPAPELPDSVSEPVSARGRRSARRSQSAQAVFGSRWRELARAGDYEAAFAALQHGGRVPDEPGALMDAADAARLSGHSAQALGFLRKVVRDHRRSDAAPLAAFTLGRVQLERLGQPRQAAEAFGMARALAPHGSLAQDALARQVEALSKAADKASARALAQEYEARYPAGRRLRAVRLYGGL